MLTIEQLKEMLDLQEQLEIRISGEDWRTQDYDYPLCIHMECAEIIDHFGWKHWKDIDKAPNVDAIAMELVDIWHFTMAYLLTFENFDADVMYTQLTEAIEEYDREPKRGIIQSCIGMGYSIFATGQFPYGNFIGVMDKIGMGFDKLYILYISKNVLNLFRQDHGYKEGTYHKYWGMKEDNEHLEEIRNSLGNDLNAKSLYDALENRYTLIG